MNDKPNGSLSTNKLAISALAALAPLLVALFDLYARVQSYERQIEALTHTVNRLGADMRADRDKARQDVIDLRAQVDARMQTMAKVFLQQREKP